MHYRVSWEIDVWAETVLEAVRGARKIQLSEDSVATIFNVFDETGHFKASVDLDGDIVMS